MFPYYYKGGEIHCLKYGSHYSDKGACIDKLSIVGLTRFNVWRLKRRMKKSGIRLNISFYEDPEDAKTWLVSD